MKKFIQTTRFGQIEISQEHVIHFRDGMIGFPQLKEYILVESSSLPILLWLQSVDAAEVAFPVMEPWFFKKDYMVSPNDADKLSIDLKPGDKTKYFVVLTIPNEMMRMTVNLKAPIVVNLNKSMATQIILQDKSLIVRTPAHEDFSKAVNQIQSQFQVTEAEEDKWAPIEVKNRHIADLGGVS